MDYDRGTSVSVSGYSPDAMYQLCFISTPEDNFLYNEPLEFFYNSGLHLEVSPGLRITQRLAAMVYFTTETVRMSPLHLEREHSWRGETTYHTTPLGYFEGCTNCGYIGRKRTCLTRTAFCAIGVRFKILAHPH